MKMKILVLFMFAVAFCNLSLFAKNGSHGGSSGGGSRSSHGGGHGGNHGGRWRDYDYVDGDWGYYGDDGGWETVPDYEPGYADERPVVVEEKRPLVDTPFLTIGDGESRYRR